MPVKNRFNAQAFDFQDKPVSLWFWISLGVSAFTLFWLMVLTISVWRLAIRPLPQLVQMSNGEGFAIEPRPYYHREPAAIKRFVEQTFKMLFTWSPEYQTLNAEGETVQKSELGVTLEPGLTVTTPAYEAALAFSEELRLPFLKKLTQLVPTFFKTHSSTTYLKIDYLSEPRALSKDTWQVDFVGNWLIRSGNSEKAISFNKTVTLRAVESYGLPLPEMASTFEQSAERIRASGLQIVDIQDFNP